jgi:hypothetical protein
MARKQRKDGTRNGRNSAEPALNPTKTPSCQIPPLEERLRHADQSLAAKFEETGNPLYVWEAWLLAYDRDRELPGWARDEMTKWALNLLELEHAPPTRRIHAEATKALGFIISGNGHNQFKQARMRREGDALLRSYYMELCKGKTVTAAIERLAHVSSAGSASTITRRLTKSAHALGFELKNFKPGRHVDVNFLRATGQSRVVRKALDDSARERLRQSQLCRKL